MRPSIAQLGAERLSDRELALAVVISMSPATAEWEPDAVKLTNGAERIAEWIAGAGDDAERHRRRVAAVLAGQSTKEIRDVVRVARQLERWTSGR